MREYSAIWRFFPYHAKHESSQGRVHQIHHLAAQDDGHDAKQQHHHQNHQQGPAHSGEIVFRLHGEEGEGQGDTGDDSHGRQHFPFVVVAKYGVHV